MQSRYPNVNADSKYTKKQSNTSMSLCMRFKCFSLFENKCMNLKLYYCHAAKKKALIWSDLSMIQLHWLYI